MKQIMLFISITLFFGLIGFAHAQDIPDGLIGATVLSASQFTLEELRDNEYRLVTEGVHYTTAFWFEFMTGLYPTDLFLTDWSRTWYALPATLHFQLGDPANELYDITLLVELFPSSELIDGAVTYEMTLVDIHILVLYGSSPEAVNVEEVANSSNFLSESILENGILTSTDLTITLGIDDEFLSGLEGARIDRLSGSRPSGIGGVVYNFTYTFTRDSDFVFPLSAQLNQTEDIGLDSEFTLLQSSPVYAIEIVDDETLILALNLPQVTPIFGLNTFVGFRTTDFASDWIATGVSLPAVVHVLSEGYEGSMLEFILDATLLPNAQFTDSILTYAMRIEDISGWEVFGESPDDVNVVEIDKPLDLFLDYIETGDLFKFGYGIVINLEVDGDFIQALTTARVDRLNDRRPLGIGEPCLPSITC